MVVVTGRTPHVRFTPISRFAGKTTLDDVEAANEALKALLDSDAVQNADRVMRLGGLSTIHQGPSSNAATCPKWWSCS